MMCLKLIWGVYYYSLHANHVCVTPSLVTSNQFATLSYYQTMFDLFFNSTHINMPMEGRMQFVAKRTEQMTNCQHGFGQYLLGPPEDGPYIGHLDGRLTTRRHYLRL